MANGRAELGRRIARARRQAGLSQRELADLAGLADSQSVSNYERGLNEPGRQRLQQIADATGKPLAYFVQGKPAQALVTAKELAELRKEVREVREMVEAVLALLRDEADPPVQQVRRGGHGVLPSR